MGSDDYILFGSVRPGEAGWQAIAPLQSPTHATLGFARPWTHSTARTAYLDSTGQLVYVEFVDAYHMQFRRFVPDAWEWTGQWGPWWNPPSDPLANDPVIPSPGCPGGPDPYDWVMQQDTDEILYQCNQATPDRNYYDVQGNLRVSGYQLWSWRADGLLLGSYDKDVFLVDPDGVATRLALPPVGSWWDIKNAKAHADGFRFVLEEYPNVRDVLVFVDAAGVTTVEGTYASPPPGVSIYMTDSFQQLDSTGAAYAHASRADGTHVVIRCPLAPDVCTIVYDEMDAPVTDLTTTPPQVWVYDFQLVGRP
jgi:hypothetical protein